MNKKLTPIIWPATAGLLAALLILDLWILPLGLPADAARGRVSYAIAVQEATPSVVSIYTAKLVQEGPNPLLKDLTFRRSGEPRPQRQRIERSLGSGVIMTKQGHILTNNHVIADADAIQIMLNDGRSANAMVIGSDSATDLAVLQIALTDLQPINLGDSDTARVGDVVLAIGNPLGFGHSVTQGIVSALGRFGLQLDTYEDYIQTDAIIHLGNSGGALIDTSGRLLGINTLIYGTNNRAQPANTGIGISLAIPVNLAVFVMQGLINYGEVIRGWLGVSVRPTGSPSSQGGTAMALAVASVAWGSPAQKAGIQMGDIITHINGDEVTDGRLTMLRIAMLKPGDNIAISLQRKQQSLELNAVVGILKDSQGLKTSR
ncbi:MAG: trypsin-like peptidase domain-containing protein [Halioglobus sp.]|nr:trypsin-like peptidase domain-containing protein [Halioglobus sp.]